MKTVCVVNTCGCRAFSHRPCALRACFVLLWVFMVPAAFGFAGGDGSAANPYQVATAEHLDAVRDHLDAHFVLTADIDLGVSPWNLDGGWEPIGQFEEDWTENPFTGSFNGQGYVIDGLYINRTEEDGVGYVGGLFGHMDGATIENLGVTNVEITNIHSDWGAAGGIAAFMDSDSLISNCYATGDVTGTATVGGLIGINSEGTVENSYAAGNVSGESWHVGGLMGENSGTVYDSFATGDVSGTGRNIGGLIGNNSEGTVENSYATGNVSGGGWHVGGLTGRNSGTVHDSFATGDVSGPNRVGGLVGFNFGGGVEYSYATGNVSGHEGVGGLVGLNSGATVSYSYAMGDITRLSGSTDERFGGFVGRNFHYQGTLGIIIDCYSIGRVQYEEVDDPTDKGFAGNADTEGDDYGMTGNFWDVDTSGQTSTAREASGKTTIEMLQLTTFSDAGWDIIAVSDIEERNTDYTWNIVNNVAYPFLSWQVGGSPHFNVNPHHNNIWGHEWPAYAELTVTIGDPADPAWEDSAHANEWGDFHLDVWDFDIQAGDLVTVTDGVTTKEHIVTSLTITEVNPDADTISGTAATNSWVDVWVHDEDVHRHVEADEHGDWTADFSVDPEGYGGGTYNIDAGSEGGAAQHDEDGDGTFAHWRVDLPHFKVDPVADHVWGHEWPVGETVTITVGDPVEFEGHASVNEWGDWNLWEAPHDIQAGDLVRVECGEIVREHVVREVQVVSVNADADTVSGTAATGSWVNVSIYGPPISRNVQADSDGFWLADFSVEGAEEWEGTYNIEANSRGCACQFDEEDNSTHISWRPDRPILRVQPASYNFGHVDLGVAVTQVFEVANIGQLDLEIGTVDLLDGHDLAQFSILEDTVTDQTLAPDVSGHVTVVFTPTNIWGKAVVLQIPSNDEEHPVYDVRIYGTGRSETVAEERFEEGLAALADFMSEFGETSDFLTANEKFGEALAADPDHYGAAIFRLLTSLFALPYDEDIAQMLTDFGMPEEGRDLWEWTAKLFEEEPAEDLPYVDEVIDLAGEKIKKLSDESLTNLSRIPTNWTGSVIFSPDHMPIDNEVQVDAGDIFMFRSGLSLLQGIICMVRAHDWHITFEDLDDEESQLSDHLANYPTLGALTNVALFAEAAGWFVEAIDLYQTGSELIRNETDYQHDDLIVFDPGSLDDERLFRNVLDQVRDSLTGTTADPFEVELSQVLDLDHFFHHPASLRDLVGGAGLQGALGSVFLHQIDRALANLEEVNDAFAQILTPEVDPVDQAVEMDHGDIWMVRAWLNTWKSLIHTAQAYDLDDVNVVAWAERDPFLMSDVFDDPGTPDLFTVTDEAGLVAASNALQAAMSAYLSGSDFLRLHAGTRPNDLFAIWANEFLMGGDRVTHDEAAFRALLEDVHFSMSEPVLIDYVNREGEHSFFEVMHLGRFFSTSYVTRAHAPEFDLENRAISGTFPDPTFNQIFPNMSQWHLADRLGMALEDTDGLGLPDLWQLHYFGETGQDLNAITPSGMTVGDAFRARTDPTDPGSYLGLTDTFSPVPGDSVVEIRWQSMPYLYYAVESVTNLLSDEWHLERIAPATPYINVFTDDSEDAIHKFYRIRLYD